MAIHPSLRSEAASQGTLSPHQTRAISAWTEQASASLENLTLSESTPGDERPHAPEAMPSRSPLRGATISLSIPLDDPAPVSEQTSNPRVNFLGPSTAQTHPIPPVTFRRREPLRRDSLKRREALVKGKDGSRRRQRWENDRLLHNPWAEPPSSHDWTVQPTHTRHDPVPYRLATLWDVHFAHLDRSSSKQTVKGTKGEKHRVPKDLRLKLKHARAARGMLQDIEEDIRDFIQRWNQRHSLLQKEGLADVPLSDDDSEDEVVFVGRNGLMHDSPQHKSQLQKMQDTMDAHSERDGEKKVFESLIDDRAAGFGRWIVHSIATYYGLHTWSVTVGQPSRREAYVGFRPPPAGIRSGLVVGPMTCGQEAMIQPGEELPHPLWAQV
ncbi:hypothetical protein FE257_009758 [Aspergillus nanangensis]|uniref:R3H-associated N-terminal domain-containing protein n=1 Tax=Aspergillus nanangensis TaxID=2582783 RepID=A0AAD4GSJ6_ASPNN|nr:hypothetical protein FE257_009758 [Aspergillus nanangensis]